MKFPGGFNIQQMMKQAQVMQEKMQKEMEELRVDASAGGGVVTVQMKGNHEIIALKIDPEVLKDDAEMLQDMIVAAVNEANRKVDDATPGPWRFIRVRPSYHLCCRFPIANCRFLSLAFGLSLNSLRRTKTAIGNRKC